MSYTMNYLEDKNIVQVRIMGRINFSTAQQYSKEAIKYAHENNCNKFLFDHTETLLEAGIYKIHMDGNTLEHFGFNSNDKIAVIISSDDNDSRFSEKAEANIKWSNIKYFNAPEKAFSWLEQVE